VNTTKKGAKPLMPTRKMRVEMFDTEGNRYSITFEGQVTRDKAVRLLDLVELLGGTPGGSNPGAGSTQFGNELSKYDKVRVVVQRHFPIVWFSSHEVQSVYEQELKEPISLSTVATYLSRMAAKGALLKTGPSNNLRYRATQNIAQTIIKQKIS
jgi:hypothetical protein